ncbi:MAG TPA: Vi polysaccharide biosynthesis protein VipA/TviB, partial [Rhizobiales bacterium]|nr:Vi polysaccharide biosynthesis protein VipA/TviB [Hyphomicrobiales bacterium]
PHNDGGWSQAHDAGRLYVQKMLGSKVQTTFKENVPDTRNTKVVDLVRTLRNFVAEVVIYDPMANVALAEQDYGLALTNELPRGPFDAVILAVKHAPIAEMGEAGIKALLAPGGLIYDLKGILPPSVSHARI